MIGVSKFITRIRRAEKDLENIGAICMVCGKNLGYVTYIPKLSTWNHIDYLPVCYKCFSRYGLPMVKPEDMEHPFRDKK